MKVLNFSGYVGWQLTSDMVGEALKGLDGEDIEVHLNTQGGSVYQGIAIYDLFANYSGKKTLYMGGLVASIGSYIATAFDRVIAQDITIYMIHNASDCVCGDYKMLRKEADALEKLNRHIADRLSRFSGKSVDAILELMDAESWYYGQEIVDAGFAMEFKVTGKADTTANVLEIAKFKYHDGMKRVAAFMDAPPAKPKEEGKTMTFKEFMENAANFVKSNEFTLEGALDLFGAKNRLMTEAQKNALDELGDLDPKVLKASAAAAEKVVFDAKMDAAFGKPDPENKLRAFAETCAKFKMPIDEIIAHPVAVELAKVRAEGTDGFLETDDTKKDDKATDSGPKRVSY